MSHPSRPGGARPAGPRAVPKGAGRLDNVVLTPHVAWVTNAGIDCMARHPVENVLAFLDGKPQFVVNPAELQG